MPGLVVSAADVNITAGDICRAVAHHLNRATAFKRFLDRFTAQQLLDTYGIPLVDGNLLKSGVGDLAAIAVTFQANRTFLDQIAGLGDV